MTDEQIEREAQDYADRLAELRPTIFPDIAEAFKDGAHFVLASQWISVDKQMPEDDRYFYLVADARLDPIGVDCAEYTCETKLFSRSGKILHPTHWCPIPQLNPEKE